MMQCKSRRSACHVQDQSTGSHINRTARMLLNVFRAIQNDPVRPDIRPRPLCKYCTAITPNNSPAPPTQLRQSLKLVHHPRRKRARGSRRSPLLSARHQTQYPLRIQPPHLRPILWDRLRYPQVTRSRDSPLGIRPTPRTRLCGNCDA